MEECHARWGYQRSAVSVKGGVWNRTGRVGGTWTAKKEGSEETVNTAVGVSVFYKSKRLAQRDKAMKDFDDP